MNNKMSSSREILQLLLRIFNEIDPENFMPGHPEGAPLNEYEMECIKLQSVIVKNHNDLNLELLKTEINTIWEEYFEKECSKADLLADKVLKEFEKYFR